MNVYINLMFFFTKREINHKRYNQYIETNLSVKNIFLFVKFKLLLLISFQLQLFNMAHTFSKYTDCLVPPIVEHYGIPCFDNCTNVDNPDVIELNSLFASSTSN